MTATLFEKYEANRLRYKPGTKWKDVGHCIIKELQIVSHEEVSTYSPVIETYFQHYDGNLVYFRVLKIASIDDAFYVGQIVAWPTEYMESRYEVICQ